MEFIDVQAEEIIQHEHPLILEDLQSMYQNYQEDDDDVDDHDLITMQKFECKCDVCGYRIDWYHRYYYRCSQSSCSYSLHKSCRELSTTLRFPAHPIHTLRLKKSSNSWSCHSCLTKHVDGIFYHCSTCDYEIDLRCATFAEQTLIHHPGHPHPLTSITLDPSLSKCYACGKKHEGVFYHCSTCFYFSIHVDCVTLPFKLSSKHHVHMLTLSYSFTVIPYHSKCRICVTSISERDWLYKCGKCRYYVHLDCALSRGEPFMSIFSHGTGKSDTNFKAANYPNLLHYPLPDESYNIIPHHLRSGDYRHSDQIKSDNMHPSHDHPLLLINAPDTLHNPMRRIKLLCDGCVRPITTPFYGCNQGCNFSLHEWCTRLPSELENHPGHTLALFNSPSELAYTGFNCSICGLLCNGFGYFCSRPRCNYRVDVHCGFIPERIMNEAHPNHLLSRVKASSIQSTSSTLACHACGITLNGGEFCFRCGFCDFYLDNRCALHLPKTIKNRYDKHPLKLSYSPIENHKSEYFCEVCEEELIPEKWFYHCQECSQSIHSACAPLILQSEQGFNDSRNDRTGVYKFMNMKFGHLVTFSRSHPHPMLLVLGTKSDIRRCKFCRRELQSLLIFKCSICELVFHVSCGPKNPRGRFLTIFERLFIDFSRIGIKLKEKLEHHETAAVTFYPTEVMRPVTGHWKTADEQP